MTSRPEVLEPDRLGQQRMGADDDVDRSRPPCRLRVALASFAETNRDKGLTDDGKTAEPLGKAAVVLARQQRRRTDDRHLHPRHAPPRRPRASQPRSCRSRRRRRSAGPSGCPFPDRPPRRQWRTAGRRFPDRGSGPQRPPRSNAAPQGSAHGATPFRRDPHQPVRDLADPLLQLGLLGLPGATAQPVEQPLFMAIAAEKLDVLDRQVKLCRSRHIPASRIHAARQAP